MSRNDDLDRDDEFEEEQDDLQDDDRSRGRGGPRDRRRGRRKEDYFAANNVVPDYKDVDTLRRFLTERAKIRPRRQTGLTSKNQRRLSRQIKRARHLALLPFTDDQNRG